LIWIICGSLGGLLVLFWAKLGKFLVSLGGQDSSIRENIFYALVMSSV